jgi:hypothetical protein
MVVDSFALGQDFPYGLSLVLLGKDSVLGGAGRRSVHQGGILLHCSSSIVYVAGP